MKTKEQSRTQTDKVVTVRVGKKQVERKDLFFLFTASQVEEVLPDITVRPIPFAPSFLQGVSLWRGHVLPVVDIGKRFGFRGTDETSKDRFLVVRTGTPDNSDRKQILRCVLRVSDQILTMDVSDSSSFVNTDRIGVAPSLVRGAYQRDEDIFIVPDLVSILQNQQSIDIF